MDDISVTVIIPCYNEENNISRCLESLEKLDYPTSLVQVIVVDNGSQDRSRMIASQFRIQLLQKAGGTIGAVRNYGAKFAHGDILAFVDADCVVSTDWIRSFLQYFRDKDNKVGIAGSPPPPPPEGNLLQHAWFSHRMEKYIGEAEYIGSANLIISQSLFNHVGGFDETIPSGEDYDLCTRVIQTGYKVISDYRIKSYHYGYPSTISAFVKREIWHGKGMTVDFKAPLKSRPLMLSLLYLLCNIFICIFLFFYIIFNNSLFLTLTLTTIGMELFPALLLSFQKTLQRRTATYFPALSTLYFIYGMSRSYSLILIAKDWLCGRFSLR